METKFLSNLEAGFKTTGIFPTNKDGISSRLPKQGRSVNLDLGVAFLAHIHKKSCPPPKECCAQGCCAYRPPLPLPPATSFVFWNHWYFGLLLLLLVASCAGGCGLWRRGRSCCCGCAPQDDDAAASDAGAPSGSLRSSAGSCCPPPHYSRCSSLHRAPPPYTEVTSKPDLYPLVISYGDAPKGSVGNSYLMVQYFRNYIVRPVGSLSAASTADSLSSSFLCSATNEVNQETDRIEFLLHL
ncbi:uncharacterized protein LOC126252425 [Schistocerca nitens]|uniref:uncharacterized protein LOC126252425 n=1 Tax=Schistocerca nitens TaxID=7011 RepID=UPI00211950C6|nr:uncharacterized protein LOC126252425 [Schistocerca nitens]